MTKSAPATRKLGRVKSAPTKASTGGRQTEAPANGSKKRREEADAPNGVSLALQHDRSSTGGPTDPQRSELDVAIATELAPAVAISLLSKSSQSPDAADPALECMAAGVSAADDDEKIRVQLVFDNGAVLPVEMPKDAGHALVRGLAEELGKADT